MNLNEFRADLHCHSTCSDGTSSPEEIVQMAFEKGLKGLSITDHDTIEAYKIALPLAQKLGLELISGAEFSAVHHLSSVHILAYAFSIDNVAIQNFCKRHTQRRKNRNLEILKLLSSKGFPLSEEEVYQAAGASLADPKSTIGRPHIALAMVKKGYIESIQEGFHKYIGEGRCCYSPGESFSTQETIDVIHEAKGLAVIAHPHLIHPPLLLKQLLEMNFDGIECYYAKFTKEAHQRWTKIAKHRRWLITGGSDYHGSIKPNIKLGDSWVDETHFQVLLSHFKKVSS